ncbi:unnamed protein product [Cyprideis torosa]|uniref:Uncharacterized protein n=1 Tax=Cyprideis torosa TaxID=163714 RepID=A0A7R8W603_9CRUS|nr:unnamed protein product [Cyprideis torosa]CAG0880478.1 unnamed protein product [Cyprideis torosa]
MPVRNRVLSTFSTSPYTMYLDLVRNTWKLKPASSAQDRSTHFRLWMNCFRGRNVLLFLLFLHFQAMHPKERLGESLPVRSQDDLQVVRRLWEHRSSGTTGDGNFVVKQENLRSKKRLRLRETERAMAQRRFVVSHRQATLLRAITGRIKMEQERKVAAIEKRWYKKKIFMNWSEQRRRRKKWLSEDAGAASGLSMESVPRPLLSHGVCPRVLPAAKQPEKNEVSAKDDQEHSVVVSLENQSSDLRSEIDKEADRILNVVLEKVCGLSLSEGGAKSTAF